MCQTCPPDEALSENNIWVRMNIKHSSGVTFILHPGGAHVGGSRPSEVMGGSEATG